MSRYTTQLRNVTPHTVIDIRLWLLFLCSTSGCRTGELSFGNELQATMTYVTLSLRLVTLILLDTLSPHTSLLFMSWCHELGKRRLDRKQWLMCVKDFPSALIDSQDISVRRLYHQHHR